MENMLLEGVKSLADLCSVGFVLVEGKTSEEKTVLMLNLVQNIAI